MTKRSSRIEREGDWTDIPGPIYYRSKRLLCSLCGRKYGSIRTGIHGDVMMEVREAIHHLIPRRWLQQRHLDPHLEVNLISICQSDHARCLRVETLLFAGDVYGFLSELRPISEELYARVFAAAKHYHLEEFLKFDAPRKQKTRGNGFGSR